MGADAAQHLEALEIRQHHVEDDDGVIALERALDAAPAGVHGLDGITFGGQIFRQQLAELPVVVDHQDMTVGGAGREKGIADGPLYRSGVRRSAREDLSRPASHS